MPAPLTPPPGAALKVNVGAPGRDAERSEGTGVATVGKFAAKALLNHKWYATIPLTVAAGNKAREDGLAGNLSAVSKLMNA